MPRKLALALLWVTASFASLLLICQPISIEAQFVMGVAAIAAMALTWVVGKDGIWRQIFLALGTAVVSATSTGARPRRFRPFTTPSISSRDSFSI
jgi:hypothetical protein